MDKRKLTKLNFQIHFIICALAILVVAGCDQQKKSETPVEISRRHERMAARELKEAAVKIFFISSMMNTSYDTIFIVFPDHKLKTAYYTRSSKLKTLVRSGIALIQRGSYNPNHPRSLSGPG